MRNRLPTLLVIASQYNQFRHWCTDKKVDFRLVKYVGSREQILGYTPDESRVVVLRGMPLDNWKEDLIGELIRLGFEVRSDYT